MFKLTLLNIGISLICVSSFAQQNLGFKKCNETRLKADSIIFSKPSDTSRKRLVIQMVEEWKECIGQFPIPNFNVVSLDGKKLNSKNLKGKILILDFWSITCSPCVAEFPALNRLVKDYASRNVVFIGFAYDKSLETKNFLKKHPFNFLIIPNSESTFKNYGINGMPNTFIVGKDGHIKNVWTEGYVGKEAETIPYENIKTEIDKMLSE